METTKQHARSLGEGKLRKSLQKSNQSNGKIISQVSFSSLDSEQTSMSSTCYASSAIKIFLKGFRKKKRKKTSLPSDNLISENSSKQKLHLFKL